MTIGTTTSESDLAIANVAAGTCPVEFIENAYPYSADPVRDLDMAGHAIVRVHPPTPRPKQAFHAVADRYPGNDEARRTPSSPLWTKRPSSAVASYAMSPMVSSTPA